MLLSFVVGGVGSRFSPRMGCMLFRRIVLHFCCLTVDSHSFSLVFFDQCLARMNFSIPSVYFQVKLEFLFVFPIDSTAWRKTTKWDWCAFRITKSCMCCWGNQRFSGILSSTLRSSCLVLLVKTWHEKTVMQVHMQVCAHRHYPQQSTLKLLTFLHVWHPLNSVSWPLT